MFEMLESNVEGLRRQSIRAKQIVLVVNKNADGQGTHSRVSDWNEKRNHPSPIKKRSAKRST